LHGANLAPRGWADPLVLFAVPLPPDAAIIARGLFSRACHALPSSASPWLEWAKHEEEGCGDLAACRDVLVEAAAVADFSEPLFTKGLGQSAWTVFLSGVLNGSF
jgi:hypothetical protein